MSWEDLLKQLEQFKGDPVLKGPVQFLDSELYNKLELFRSVSDNGGMMLVPDFAGEVEDGVGE